MHLTATVHAFVWVITPIVVKAGLPMTVAAVLGLPVVRIETHLTKDHAYCSNSTGMRRSKL
jgi:hypothetical protein